MPFTFSHPAAILPIHSKWKKWIPLAPLVVGSLVPDAGYYLPMPEFYKENAHTFLGAFTFSLPVGIAALLIFYWLAPELVFLLPSPHREVLQARTKLPSSFRDALMVVCGIVLGAETHVLWDSFTHETGWMVERVALLREFFFETRIPVYLALQVLSSLFGLFILLYAYDRSMKEAGFRRWLWQKPSWRSYLWFAVLAGCFAGAIIESDTVHAIFYVMRSRHFILIFIISFVQNVLIALCALSICVKLLNLHSIRDTAY